MGFRAKIEVTRDAVSKRAVQAGYMRKVTQSTMLRRKLDVFPRLHCRLCNVLEKKERFPAVPLQIVQQKAGEGAKIARKSTVPLQKVQWSCVFAAHVRRLLHKVQRKAPGADRPTA